MTDKAIPGRLVTFECSRSQLTGNHTDEVPPEALDVVNRPLRKGWIGTVQRGSLKRSDLWFSDTHLVSHSSTDDPEDPKPGVLCTGDQTSAAFIAVSLVGRNSAPVTSPGHPPVGSIIELTTKIVEGADDVVPGTSAGVIAAMHDDGTPSLSLIVLNDGGTLWWGRSTEPGSPLELRIHHLAGLWSSLLEMVSPLAG